MGLACGIDIGAAATKVALLDKDLEVVGKAVIRTGVDFATSAEKALGIALEDAGASREDVEKVVACGYGRHNVAFADAVRTEIACHGVGAYHYFPRAITIVDIGGQDNKIIKLDEAGRRVSFKMNRKCAAGTGAFLEEMALRLDIPIERLEPMARAARTEATLGSFCTVFTASEVLARIREGTSPESLVKGLMRSVVKRVVEMDVIEGEVVMTGGVVEHNPILVEMMAEETGAQVHTPPYPQLNGAIGAAIVAARMG